LLSVARNLFLIKDQMEQLTTDNTQSVKP